MSWVGRLFQPLLGLDINPTQFIMCKTQPNPHGSGWSNGFCIHVLCLVKKKKKKKKLGFHQLWSKFSDSSKLVLKISTQIKLN